MSRHVQTNFTAADFMVGSTKDSPASKASKSRSKAKPEAAKAADPNAVPDGTTEEVLAWVGDDAERAQRALDKENEGDSPRVTLVEPLEKQVEAAPPSGTIDEVMDWVGDDEERAQAALDAENAKDKPRKGLVEDLEDLLTKGDDDK